MEAEVQDTCFTGVAEHALDAKGRVSLPAKARRYLPDTVKCVLSLDKKSVYVFAPAAYDAWFKSFFREGFNPRSARDVQLRARLLAFTEEADIDSAGRIGITGKLRDIAGLEKEVAIIGGGDHLEICDRAAYRRAEQDLLAMDFLEE